MVIGLSGSGKTSLIRRITGDIKADPSISTARYQIFSKSTDIPANNAISRCKIYLSDYPGQTALAELIRGFIEQQSIPYSPMRFGYVNSLILVVDLFRPPNVPNETVPKQNQLDEQRIQENIEQCNQQALSAIFGMLPPNSQLKYVCLFINKIDLLNQRIPDDQIFKKYQILYNRLVDMAPRGISYKRLIGSGITGENIITLEEDLKTNSTK